MASTIASGSTCRAERPGGELVAVGCVGCTRGDRRCRHRVGVDEFGLDRVEWHPTCRIESDIDRAAVEQPGRPLGTADLHDPVVTGDAADRGRAAVGPRGHRGDGRAAGVHVEHEPRHVAGALHVDRVECLAHHELSDHRGGDCLMHRRRLRRPAPGDLALHAGARVQIDVWRSAPASGRPVPSRARESPRRSGRHRRYR